MNVTPSQFKVAAAIRNFHILRGRRPSFQMIADLLGLGKVSVWEIVERLRREGVVYGRGSVFGLAIVEGLKLPDENRASKMPYLGEIR